MLFINDSEKFSVIVEHSAAVTRIPMNIELKRVIFDIGHIFVEFGFQNVWFGKMRNGEQIFDILPVDPFGKQ